MSTRHLLTLSAVLALGLAGCAEGTDGSTGDTVEDPQGAPEEIPSSVTPSDGATTTSGDAAAGGTTVTVENISFPQRTTVTAGEPVTFENQDSVAHTVTSGLPEDGETEDQGIFDEDLPAGGQVTITVDEPGTYRYHCEIHQQMTSRIVVEPA